MRDDIVLDKAQIIERRLRRVDEVYAGDPASLEDLTRQDWMVLNIEAHAKRPSTWQCMWWRYAGWDYPKPAATRLASCAGRGSSTLTWTGGSSAWWGFATWPFTNTRNWTRTCSNL